jgi:hypothetical protein
MYYSYVGYLVLVPKVECGVENIARHSQITQITRHIMNMAHLPHCHCSYPLLIIHCWSPWQSKRLGENSIAVDKQGDARQSVLRITRRITLDGKE